MFYMLFLLSSMSSSFSFILSLFNIQGTSSKHWKPVPPEGCQHQTGRRASSWPKRHKIQMQPTCSCGFAEKTPFLVSPCSFQEQKKTVLFGIPYNFCVNHVYLQVYFFQDRLLEMLMSSRKSSASSHEFSRDSRYFEALGLGRKVWWS